MKEEFVQHFFYALFAAEMRAGERISPEMGAAERIAPKMRAPMQSPEIGAAEK